VKAAMLYSLIHVLRKLDAKFLTMKELAEIIERECGECEGCS
jgi:hypothetical protein